MSGAVQTQAVVALQERDDAEPEQLLLPPVHVCVCVEASVPHAAGQDEGYDQVPVGHEAPLSVALHDSVAGEFVAQYPLPPTQVYAGVEAAQDEGQVGAVQVPVGHEAPVSVPETVPPHPLEHVFPAHVLAAQLLSGVQAGGSVQEIVMLPAPPAIPSVPLVPPVPAYK